MASAIPCGPASVGRLTPAPQSCTRAAFSGCSCPWAMHTGGAASETGRDGAHPAMADRGGDPAQNAVVRGRGHEPRRSPASRGTPRCGSAEGDQPAQQKLPERLQDRGKCLLLTLPSCAQGDEHEQAPIRRLQVRVIRARGDLRIEDRAHVVGPSGPWGAGIVELLGNEHEDLVGSLHLPEDRRAGGRRRTEGLAAGAHIYRDVRPVTDERLIEDVDQNGRRKPQHIGCHEPHPPPCNRPRSRRAGGQPRRRPRPSRSRRRFASWRNEQGGPRS
jgi:hypothetical protein